MGRSAPESGGKRPGGNGPGCLDNASGGKSSPPQTPAGKELANETDSLSIQGSMVAEKIAEIEQETLQNSEEYRQDYIKGK